MTSKAGYFKPAIPGKTFRVPRDFCLCRDPRTGSLKRTTRTVDVVIDNTGEYFNDPLVNLNPNYKGKRHRLPGRKGDIVGAFVGPCNCPEGYKPQKKRKSKGPKRGVSTSMSRYRERNTNLQQVGSIPAGAKLGVFKVFQNNQLSSSQNVNTTGSLPGHITAERCWDSTNSGPPYRSGGPFGLVKIEVPGGGRYHLSQRSNQFSPGFWWQYDGDFIDNGDWASDTVGNYTSLQVPAITGFDTLAWDKTKPRVEKANLAQFVYELRDLPGQLKTSMDSFVSFYRFVNGRGDPRSLLQPKVVAENFLNHEFGWVPFMSDYIKFLDVWQNSTSFITDLVANNGRWQRRRASLESSSTERLVQRMYYPAVEPFGSNIQGLCDTISVDGIPCKGYCDIREVVETKTWACGRFTFYRPEFDMDLEYGNSYLVYLQRIASLYGLRLTPTLLWKITPWTWTVDWFTHFGDYIKRLDDFTVDGIVSRGLYIMRTTQRKVFKISTIFFNGGKRTIVWQRSFQTKARKVADSPYGFDLTWSNLSARQYAILGAIGLTRSNSGFISRGA